MAKKSRTPGQDRTKTGPTRKRNGREPRPPRRTGPLAFLLALAFGGLALTAAVQWTPTAVRGLAATAGWTGAEATLRVTDCAKYSGGRRSVTMYGCSGAVAPLSAAPGAMHGVVWIKPDQDDLRGHTVAVDCPPQGSDCVRTGGSSLVDSVVWLYALLGVYGLGVGVPAVAVHRRWPGRFPWFTRRRARLRRVAGWTAAGVAAGLAGLLIAIGTLT